MTRITCSTKHNTQSHTVHLLFTTSFTIKFVRSRKIKILSNIIFLPPGTIYKMQRDLFLSLVQTVLLYRSSDNLLNTQVLDELSHILYIPSNHTFCKFIFSSNLFRNRDWQTITCSEHLRLNFKLR